MAFESKTNNGQMISLNFTDIGIKSVEIVKGPSSLLYGADALGGVLYFVDEDYLGQILFKAHLKADSRVTSIDK